MFAHACIDDVFRSFLNKKLLAATQSFEACLKGNHVRGMPNTRRCSFRIISLYTKAGPTQEKMKVAIYQTATLDKPVKMQQVAPFRLASNCRIKYVNT